MVRMKEVREQHGIKQSALVDTLGWGQSRVSNYETGERTPGLEECRQIVAALNKLGASCTLDDVFPVEQKAAS